jgi:hypothetical protein
MIFIDYYIYADDEVYTKLRVNFFLIFLSLLEFFLLVFLSE